MIHYEIDTTENGYNTIQGDAETIGDIRNILIKNNRPARKLMSVFRMLTKRVNITPDCVGYITTDNMPNSQVCLSAQNELGMFLGITDNSELYLSLFDSERLDDLVDIWGDGLYISRGLFIPEELAWKAIENFILNGTLWDKIKWIDPDDLPENANYIC